MKFFRFWCNSLFYDVLAFTMKGSLGHELPREEECSCWDLSEGGWRGCPAALGCNVARRLQLQRSATTTAIMRDTQLVELSSPPWAQDNEYSRRYYSEETLLWMGIRGKPHVSLHGRRFFDARQTLVSIRKTRDCRKSKGKRLLQTYAKQKSYVHTEGTKDTKYVTHVFTTLSVAHIHTYTYTHLLCKVISSELSNFVIAMGQEFVKLLYHSLTWIFERKLIRVT